MLHRRLVWFGIVLVLAAIPAIGAALSSSSHPLRDFPPSSPTSGLLESPASIALGRLAPGERAEAGWTLSNRTAAVVRLDRVESSCPCVRVEPIPTTIDPGGQANLRVVFDPAEEPDFRGGLAVDLTGRGPTGVVLFRSTVDLTVSGPIATPPTRLEVSR